MEDKEDATSTSVSQQNKNPIEVLSKEEIINKYKGLLGIAKKAKQAKDELAEENRKLKEELSHSEAQKEADKNALMTMKEMLEQFTDNKLQLTTKLSELQNKSKADDEVLRELSIENESLKRQVDRLTEDNESLLSDIDQMESQLKQVNLLGIEQKKHLSLLELEVNKLKEAESSNANLKNQVGVIREENKALKDRENAANKALGELQEKYNNVKEINAEQRQKFNTLKERFIEVHRKVNKLKECKQALLETQHEYAESVSKWQKEIVYASHLLFAQMKALQNENEQLSRKFSVNDVRQSVVGFNFETLARGLRELESLCERAIEEYMRKNTELAAVEEENRRLKEKLKVAGEEDMDENRNDPASRHVALVKENCSVTEHIVNVEELKLQNKRLSRELNDLKAKLIDTEEQIEVLQAEKRDLEKFSGEQKIVEETSELPNEETKNKGNEENVHETSQTHGRTMSQCEGAESKSQKIRTPPEQDYSILLEKLLVGEDLGCSFEHESQGNLLKKLSAKLTEYNAIQEQLTRTQQSFEVMAAEKSALLTQLQQQTVNEVDKQALESVQKELLACRQSYDELHSRFELKEREHDDLLCEMRELNEALKARGDVISRQEKKYSELSAEFKTTVAKLKEIEDKLIEKEQSISEKDGEVRNISREVDLARNKVQQMEGIYLKNEEHVRVLTEELQSLRSAEGLADSQSDVLSTSTISRAEELSRLHEVDESFEEKYNKLRGLAAKLKKKLQEKTAYAAELEKHQAEVEPLKKELEECKQRVGDLQSENEKSWMLAETLKAENQKLKTSRKQANVLNLEIEAAEKSLNEATAKLAAKVNELESMNEVLTSKENTIVQLRKEVAILESAKQAESEHSRELKEQIDILQKQIKDTVHVKQTLLVSHKELEQCYENLKLECEDMRLELAKAAREKEAALLAANNGKKKLDQELFETKEMLHATQLSLKTTEHMLEDLRVEYLDYKVKAQTVLRKNQSKDTSKEHELEEELLSLRAIESTLQTQAQIHIKRIAEGDKQIELLQEDNESLQRRCKELLNVIEELRQQNEQLAHENRSQMQMQQESFQHHREQIENLDACHQEQLKELETSYLRQIEQLKAEYVKTVRAPTTIGGTTTTHFPTSEQTKIDFLLMEREDAEGSEEAEGLASIASNRKISNASRRSQHDFMPLDELLNAPMNTIRDTVTTITANSLGRNISDLNSNTENIHVELQATKERLKIQESRVRHLTALLAENEQDLAKLTQMNDMLKEELRRQERGVEREKHMHNSEYLKNIIIKFLTLNNGDERIRLVPVLNTILRLSPSETEVLNCVAKGQKVTTESNNRGWSTLLPGWGGGGTSN